MTRRALLWLLPALAGVLVIATGLLGARAARGVLDQAAPLLP